MLRHLLARCDIFIQNMTKGTLDELGLGYEELRRANPGYPGFDHRLGQKGPLAQEPGYDVLVQVFTGTMRWPTSNDEPPEIVGLRGDPTSPLIAALATMVALRRRDRTGEGALVTTSVLQGGMGNGGAALAVAEQDASPPPAAGGRGVGSTGGLGAFKTADGEWVFLCGYNDRQFRWLCDLAGFPEVGQDPQYATRSQRTGDAGNHLNELFAYWVSTKSRDEVIAEARARRCQCRRCGAVCVTFSTILISLRTTWSCRSITPRRGASGRWVHSTRSMVSIPPFVLHPRLGSTRTTYYGITGSG